MHLRRGHKVSIYAWECGIPWSHQCIPTGHDPVLSICQQWHNTCLGMPDFARRYTYDSTWLPTCLHMIKYYKMHWCKNKDILKLCVSHDYTIWVLMTVYLTHQTIIIENNHWVISYVYHSMLYTQHQPSVLPLPFLAHMTESTFSLNTCIIKCEWWSSSSKYLEDLHSSKSPSCVCSSA